MCINICLIGIVLSLRWPKHYSKVLNKISLLDTPSHPCQNSSYTGHFLSQYSVSSFLQKFSGLRWSSFKSNWFIYIFIACLPKATWQQTLFFSSFKSQYLEQSLPENNSSIIQSNKKYFYLATCHSLYECSIVYFPSYLIMDI